MRSSVYNTIDFLNALAKFEEILRFKGTEGIYRYFVKSL